MAWNTENVFLFKRYLGTFYYYLFVLKIKYDGQKNTF